MTKYDLKIAAILIALVVAVGLALGYGVGWMNRPDTLVGSQSDTAPLAENTSFAAPANTETAHPPGGTLPGYKDIYINDYQGLLDKAASAKIRGKLVDLYDRTGVEMTVLTIKDMRTYGHGGAIESFATALFNAWGIGNAGRNDGVLILISRFDRKMRIELGAGYPASYDVRMQRVIDAAFLPAFGQDKYQRGIEQGVDATIFEIAGAYPGEHGNSTLQQGWSQIARWLRQIGAWVLAILVLPLAGFSLWLRRYWRNRPKRCGRCAQTMQRLGEQADDAHLDGGQKLEEFLKSIDYDVWICPICTHMDIIRYKTWFSSLGACPQCNYRTMSTESTVLTSASTTSTGRKRLDYSCAHCSYEDSEFRTIPKVSKSSSSSGGSSFGGGSSSGGGASGSW